MNYQRVSQMNTPGLAAGKKARPAGFAIAGMMAFHLGLAANAHAIPISTAEDPNAAGRPWILSQGEDATDFVHFFGRESRNRSLTAPTVFLSRSLPSGIVRESRAAHLRDVRWGHKTPPLASRPNPKESPASVPDGGTTGVMLGGAFSGLVFLKKQFKSRIRFSGTSSS
jgi:hypothetical protein